MPAAKETLVSRAKTDSFVSIIRSSSPVGGHDMVPVLMEASVYSVREQQRPSNTQLHRLTFSQQAWQCLATANKTRVCQVNARTPTVTWIATTRVDWIMTTRRRACEVSFCLVHVDLSRWPIKSVVQATRAR
jgi:hypothetical protein